MTAEETALKMFMRAFELYVSSAVAEIRPGGIVIVSSQKAKDALHEAYLAARAATIRGGDDPS